jgi:uncharacterized protein YaaW (UPF0174 family)
MKEKSKVDKLWEQISEDIDDEMDDKSYKELLDELETTETDELFKPRRKHMWQKHKGTIKR